jgi:ketosteroid isomerase-like protein
MRANLHRLLTITVVACATSWSHAQLQVPAATPADNSNSVLTDPTFHANAQVLLDADKRFAADVAQGGGAAFVSWFAPDAVTLNNKKAVVQGKTAIAAQANWKPADYQLTWAPEGARIGQHGEMGITWGHYQGHSKDNQGNLLVTSGRYLTVWEKDTSGQWKVLADSSNEAPAEDESCCSIH